MQSPFKTAKIPGNGLSQVSTKIAGAAFNESTPEQRAQVVIVGAGLAALAAAQRLHESGVKDVILLEALDRIGGRVHTISHSNYLLELGAQWLHGADENPLHQWLADKNMLDDFEDASIGFRGIFCTARGEEVEPELVRRVLDIMVEAKLSLSKRLCDGIAGKNGIKNAGELFKHFLDGRIEADEQLKAKCRLVYAIFKWFLRYETIENCCDSMDEVSVSSYTDWNDAGDGTLLNFKHGYRSLLEWFSDHLPARQWIHLNKQVVNIELLSSSNLASGSLWLDDSGGLHERPLVVRYMDTRGDEQVVKSIECNHVVVTSSLGFLKANHATLFKPQLPENKRQLIDSIGFGTVNKIVLQFDCPFWTESNGIKMVWEDDARQDEFPVWVRDIIAFDVVRRQPNLLIGWIGGQGAKMIEQETDELVGSVCLRVIKRFLPPSHEPPSRLVGCICSRWSSNPFICGSYSFQSMKSYDLDVDSLIDPICSSTINEPLGPSSESRIPRVLFAGEATAGKLYSTTHGAIISGWREADRLADHLQQSNISTSLIQSIGTSNHLAVPIS